MKALNPDIVIPANYYNEYALLVRTMQQQKVTPKAIYSVLGGAASSYKFVKEFPDAANGIIDCNHWFNPKDKRAAELRKRVEAKGQFFTYEVFNTYTAVQPAGRCDRARQDAPTAAAIIDALAQQHLQRPLHALRRDRSSSNGQNAGAQPLDDAGAEGRHPGDRAARIPRGRPGVSAACLSAQAAARARLRHPLPVGPERPDDRRGLRADRAGADA